MTRGVTNLVATEDHAHGELLGRASDIMSRTIADVCVIALLSHNGGMLHPLGLSCRDASMRAALDADIHVTWDPSGPIAAPVLASGTPSVYRRRELAEAARGDPVAVDFIDRWKVHSAIVVAMRVSGERVGILGIASQDGSPGLSDREVPFVQAVADRLALAVANLHLRDEIERLRAERHPPLPDARLHELTTRELEILRLIGEGLTSREIGERLFLSTRTIEWHRGRLSAKLGEHQRSELIAVGRTIRS